MSRLVHLHRHSEWSMLDGTGTCEQYARRAAELGQSALAITDHGTIAGALHHIAACESVGVTPIVGMEAYFKPNRHLKDNDNRRRWHLVLLAANQTGWQNLVRLSSEAHSSGFYYAPCADWDLLERFGEGLIATTACVSGPLPDLIVSQSGNNEVSEYMGRMKKIFGDRFAVEIMPHDFDGQRLVNAELVNIANEHGVPYIATVDAHYPYEDWADTQDVLLMISTRQTVEERIARRERGEDVYTFGSKTLFLMDETRLAQEFADHHGYLPKDVVDTAIANTSLVASWVEPFTISKKDKLPKVSPDDDPGFGERLVSKWCREGMDSYGLAGDPVYEERLEYEMSVLRDKGVIDYFAIIGDLIKWARSEKIRIGIGRGSAAGSLVSYLIGITGLDPIKHGLLFERFLNPHRKGMPDIDLDFEHERRDEAKDYLGKRWGHDHIAEIGAYQRFALKNALKDVAKVLCVPYEDVNHTLKAMDGAEMGTKLEQMRAMSPDVQAFSKKYPDCWKHAVRLEGQTKTLSRHPAGVLVTDKPVSEYMPMIRRDTTGVLVTAWTESVDFKVISSYGFMKIDVLSIDGLTVQRKAVELIKERHGIDIDLDRLPVFQDPDMGEQDVLQAFGQDMTLGVFQFESRGIRGLLRQIKPDHFNDIVAANALYRPGPLVGGVAHSYGNRKNGRERWSFWHPAVEPFLAETYGLIVYQEQVMQIVQALGDFSMAEADDIRKAMTKLHAERVDVDDDEGGTKKISAGEVEMRKHQGKFLEGCAGKGISVSDANEIWEKIVQFSVYGFNKSHSAGYAGEAYKDMWLKLRYPHEFYTALLTYEPKKVPDVIREARNRGIKVLQPDVNTSGIGFTLDGDDIRYGLASIKFVGDAAIQEIMSQRAERRFNSLEDFEARVPSRRCNKRVRESLLRAGAMDRFGGRDEWTDAEKRVAEVELMGTVISLQEESPYKSILAERLVNRDEFDLIEDGGTAIVGGEITSIRVKTTRKGTDMAYVDVRFGDSDYSVTVFPRQYQEFADIITPGEIVLIKGTKDRDRDCVILNNACTAAELKRVLEA